MVYTGVMRYTITDLQRDFPDDNACLDWLVDYLYPEGIYCKQCKRVTPHHRMKTRKSYSCESCGHHVHPTAGTIFHKSTTPLTLWFYAVFLMASTRSGISAKQLERELGVTYKTAWRMFHMIRTMMIDESDKLTGDVEIDEMYLKARPQRRTSVKAQRGEIVFGAVQRGGVAKVEHVQDSSLLIGSVQKSVDQRAQIYSDGYMAYKSLWWQGYQHKSVNHIGGEWVRGNVHVNSVENLWSYIRRGIRGVYIHVDPKYLQAYINEYSFRYDWR